MADVTRLRDFITQTAAAWHHDESDALRRGDAVHAHDCRLRSDVLEQLVHDLQTEDDSSIIVWSKERR